MRTETKKKKERKEKDKRKKSLQHLTQGLSQEWEGALKQQGRARDKQAVQSSSRIKCMQFIKSTASDCRPSAMVSAKAVQQATGYITSMTAVDHTL